MYDFESRLRSAVKSLEKRDPELASEMKAVRKRPGAVDEARNILGARQPSGGLESTGGVAVANAQTALETIVLRTGRPVLAIHQDQVDLDSGASDVEVWKERLGGVRSLLEPAIRAAGRVELAHDPQYEWVGTAWLVRNDVIVTNRHVAQVFGRRNGDRYVFRMGVDQQLIVPSIDFLEEVGRTEERVFRIEEILHIEEDPGPDIALLRVSSGGEIPLADPIVLSSSPAEVERYVAVIGYPARDSRIPEPDLMASIFGDIYDKKRLAPGQVTGSTATELLHDCSTLGGNSGSVVLDLKTGKALGLHFSGRFLVANYAVHAALIESRLQQLEGARPRSGRRGGSAGSTNGHGSSPGVTASRPSTTPVPAASSSDARTRASLTIPVHFSIELGRPMNRVDAQAPSRTADPGDDDLIETTLESREDLSDRAGYDSEFLGRNAEVALPAIRAARDVLPVDGDESGLLRYEHFSVVMSRSRRLCFLSAVNIDGGTTRRIKRTGWKLDPRIPTDAQIIHECYGNPPKFSRGHMTRREDPIWGSSAEAGRGNSDSMHVTNVVPQMQPFNAPVWLGLEDYALEHAREDDMKISVFTGPYFTARDPEYDGVQVPRSFWKVIAFIHDDTGELSATGYEMSQADFLETPEFVFGQYTTPEHVTTQVPIRTIESRAGLSFQGLSAVDPLDRAPEAPARPLRYFHEIRLR